MTVVLNRSTMPLTPLLVIPGYMGSLPTDANKNKFGLTRGFPASGMTVAPAYLDLVSYFEKQGYEKDKNLFVLPYDWRIPLALPDGKKDGVLSAVTAGELTDGVIKTQVDYLGQFLGQLAAKNPSLSKIDIIAHSNGNNVARAYVQSAGYGGSFVSGQNLRLPTVETLIQLAPPSEGAALAWNVWNNNIISLDALSTDPKATKTLVRDLSLLYNLIARGLAKVVGPDRTITKESLRDASGKASPLAFMRQYFPSLQTLNPTNDFLYGRQGQLTNINADPNSANAFLLDLNAKSSLGDNPWAAAVDRVLASYGVTVTTVNEDQTKIGLGGTTKSVATGNITLPTSLRQTWYKQLPKPNGGDGVVPLPSLQSTYKGDPRIVLKPWGQGVPTPELPFTPTTGSVDHMVGILQNPEIRAWMVQSLASPSQAKVSRLVRAPQAAKDPVTGLASASSVSRDTLATHGSSPRQPGIAGYGASSLLSRVSAADERQLMASLLAAGTSRPQSLNANAAIAEPAPLTAPLTAPLGVIGGL